MSQRTALRGILSGVLIGAFVVLGSPALAPAASASASASMGQESRRAGSYPGADGITVNLTADPLARRNKAADPGFTVTVADTNPSAVSFDFYYLSGVPAGWKVQVAGADKAADFTGLAGTATYKLAKADATGGAVSLLPPIGFTGAPQLQVGRSQKGAANLVTDFDNGTFDFIGQGTPRLPAAASSYTYLDPTLPTPPDGGMVAPGNAQYAIWPTARIMAEPAPGKSESHNITWADLRSVTTPLTGHTDLCGSWTKSVPEADSAPAGKLMVVNGSDTAPPPDSFLTTTIAVQPDTVYDFSAYVANVQYVNQDVGVRIAFWAIADGVETQLGSASDSPQQATCDNPAWGQRNAVFYSGTSTSLTLQVRNNISGFNGNDLGLDQIELKPLATAKFPATVIAPTLKIGKVADVATAKPGDKVTYTTTITNTGTIPANDQVVTDDLTKVLDDATYNNDAAASPAGGAISYTEPKLTWTGDIPVGGKVTLTYTATVKRPITGDHQLINVVTTPDSDCPPGSTKPECSPVVNLPDVRVKKVANRRKVVPGDTVTYTTTITNTGKGAAKGQVVTDDMTGILDDSTYNKDAKTSPNTGTIAFAKPKLTWTGDVPAGATITLTYTVKINNPDTGDAIMSNVITSTDTNCPPGSKDPDCNPVFPAARIVVSKVVNKTKAHPGDTVAYTLTVTNTGAAAATGQTVTDNLTKVLDDATYNGDVKATSGKATYTKPKITWKGDVKPAQVITITYSVKINDPDRGDHLLINAVTPPSGGECVPGKCTTKVTVFRLKILKVANRATARPGQPVKYTIKITNTGTAAYTTTDPARFTDDLSRQLNDAKYGKDAKATTGKTTYKTPKLTWQGPLAVGRTATITYTLVINNKPGKSTLLNVVYAPDSNCKDGKAHACTTKIRIKMPEKKPLK